MELLRDRRAAFDELGVQPVGISRDSPWTHIAWTQALDLNFGLLSDWNAEAGHGFGIAMNHRGLKNVGSRSALLVDESGVIRNASAHETSTVPDVDEWLDACRALKGASKPG